MIALVKLHHVSFAIRDLEASKQFFGEVLQLPEIARPDFQFPGAWYAIGDRQLHLIAETSNSTPGTSGLSRSDHMALEVRNVETVKNILHENGIDYSMGTNGSLGMDQIFCRDPDGHVIEFVYYHKHKT